MTKNKKYFYRGRRMAIEVRKEEQMKLILAFKARLYTEGKSLTAVLLEFMSGYLKK